MAPAPGSEPPAAEAALPRLTGWLRPLVDAVARIETTIQHKLLAGFVGGALLLVGMGALSLLVIARMNERVEDLEAHVGHANRGQQMLYLVTAQSHYRAMAILTTKPEYPIFLEDSAAEFASLLDEADRVDVEESVALDRMRLSDVRFQDASDEVTALYEAGDLAGATRLHVQHEHELSHVLEDQLGEYVERAHQDIDLAAGAFRGDRALLQNLVVGISLAAVVAAMLAGFVLSWSIILPVKRMETALAAITSGRFGHRVRVVNRDEFGQLAHDLDVTSGRLAALFGQQRALTRRLAQTNASLVRASEAKSRFLASVSHELRTPMNAILGFTDALLAGVDGPLNDEQRDSLGWVQRGARDLLGLINEILDLSRIEAGRLSIEPASFDPRELLEALVAQHRSLAAQKGLRLRWRDEGLPAEVVLDRQRVRQILTNLVGNAVKFSADGEVEVVARSVDGRFTVAVRDTGPGIPLDQQDEIFEEFRTGTGPGAGTGLGLTISRRLARAMGGDVTVRSDPGRGSTFTVELPVEFQRPAGDAVPAVPGQRAAGDRLLLSVDDDPSVLPLLQKVLAGTEFQVVAATDASTAVDEARRLRPHAVLLDVLMPERGGEEVLQELKSDPGTSDIPVVVVSIVDRGDVPATADAFVPKPVDRAALLRALDAATQGQEVQPSP